MRSSAGSEAARSVTARWQAANQSLTAPVSSRGDIPAGSPRRKVSKERSVISEAISPPPYPPMPSATRAVKRGRLRIGTIELCASSRINEPSTRAMSSLPSRTRPVTLTASYRIFIVL